MPYQNKCQVISGLVVIQGDKPYGLKFISVWEPYRFETFCPPERLPDPRTELLPGVYLDMAWFLLTTDDIPFLQIKLIYL